jgi:hypothetical protein
MSVEDSMHEVRKLKQQTKSIRANRYGKSRLDKHRTKLLLLKKHGASAAELQRWLLSHRIKVVWTTVDRWLQKNG